MILEEKVSVRRIHTYIDTIEQLIQHLADSEQKASIPGWILAVGVKEDTCEENIIEKIKFTTRNNPFSRRTTK
ncbi:MAG: hypothetical protein WAM95_13305 [Bacillus sp. (in: firmicutes)]